MKTETLCGVFDVARDSIRQWQRSLYAVSMQPHHATSSSVAAMREIFQRELDDIREAGTWSSELVITSRQGPAINVDGHASKVLNFSANNYLDLFNHPEVINASRAALEKYGAGLSSARFICGTQDIHKELEAKIAKFHGREDAILYASCFDANAGLFEVMLTAQDAVLSHELNHASIIDGIRLCKAQKYRFSHRDLNGVSDVICPRPQSFTLTDHLMDLFSRESDLEEKLKAAQGARMRLIATEGVFSMDGNVAPLREICDLADKYNALVFVDDCHATGFFGETGRGTDEHCGVGNRVDIINSSLSKALGGAIGGYTTGPKELIELLRQRSRTYLFTTSLPPVVVGSALKVFDILMESSDPTKQLAENTTLFRTRMTEAGFTLLGDFEHPICLVMLGDARLAGVFAEKMLERNIYVIGISYPAVPKGKARIRVILSASHSEEDVNHAVDAFITVGKDLKVIA